MDLNGAHLIGSALSGLSFTPPVTVKNGTLLGLSATNCAGISFEGITFVADNTLFPMRITTSSRLAFTGGLFETRNAAAGADLISRLLYLDACSDVAVTGCEFRYGAYGVAMLDCVDVTIGSNDFHHLSNDGVQASGPLRLTIEYNHFHDFTPAAGAHPDPIQIYTVAGNVRAPTTITIRFNDITGDQIQGIQIKNDAGTPDKVPTDILLEGNDVGVGFTNGIGVQHGTNVRLLNNKVRRPPVGNSYLTIASGVGITEMVGNQALYNLPGGFPLDPSNGAPPP